MMLASLIAFIKLLLPCFTMRTRYFSPRLKLLTLWCCCAYIRSRARQCSSTEVLSSVRSVNMIVIIKQYCSRNTFYAYFIDFIFVKFFSSIVVLIIYHTRVENYLNVKTFRHTNPRRGFILSH